MPRAGLGRARIGQGGARLRRRTEMACARSRSSCRSSPLGETVAASPLPSGGRGTFRPKRRRCGGASHSLPGWRPLQQPRGLCYAITPWTSKGASRMRHLVRSATPAGAAHRAQRAAGLRSSSFCLALRLPSPLLAAVPLALRPALSRWSLLCGVPAAPVRAWLPLAGVLANCSSASGARTQDAHPARCAPPRAFPRARTPSSCAAKSIHCGRANT